MTPDAPKGARQSRKSSTRKHLVQRLAPFVLLLTILFGSPARAQQPPAPSTLPDPPVALTKEQIAVFQDALRALAIQGHVAIVAEGTPLRSKLPSRDVPRLDEHWPLSAVVERIAAAYDYDAQRRGNLFVLKKRFSDPNDLPNVTPEECRLALDDVLRVLAPFDPGEPDMLPGRKNPLLIRLAASFTPAQLEAMRQMEGGGGLPVAILNPEQQAMVRRFALTSYIHYPATDVRGIRARLALMPTVTLRVKKERHVTTVTQSNDGHATTQSYIQETVFGYEFPDSLRRPQFVPLDQGGTPGPAQTWLEEKVERHPEPQDGQEGCVTLHALITALNARGAKAQVDSALQDKTVTVFGSDAVSPAEVISALADIYGLRIRAETDGTRRLTRPLCSMPSDLSAIPESVRKSLPTPLLRAMHDGELEELNRQSQKLLRQYGGSPSSEAQLTAWQAQQQRIDKRGFDLRLLPDTLRQVAVRRLRSVLETHLSSQATSIQAQLMKGTQSEPVPLFSLPQTARSAFAVVMMTDVLETVIHTLGTQAPSWVARPDQDYLIGGLIPDPERAGKQMFSMTVAGQRADGSLQPGTGTDTEYDP